MTTAANLYQRMGIARLQALAATEGEHQDEAARAYVDRLADMELERRLWMRHQRPGSLLAGIRRRHRQEHR